MSSDKDRLIEQEHRISASFLKHSPKEKSMNEEEEENVLIFFETVAGVHEIVKSRLYRSEANSLESYFNIRWGISRAQVYRYMDCYFVLNQLEGFEELPARERLCRSLKKCAKNEEDMRKLWEYTLVLAGDERPIPTQLIQDAWNHLKKGKKLEIQNFRKRSISENSSKRLHSPKRLRTSSQISESRISPRRTRTSSQISEPQSLARHISIDDLITKFEKEEILEEGITKEPVSSESADYLEYLEETSKDQTVDELVQALFSTMDALSEMGYKLQPKVGQGWCPIPIKQWRMVPSDIDMSMEVPSLVRSSSSGIVDNWHEYLE